MPDALDRAARDEIAASIYAELERAARTDGVTFDDEQRGLITQALADAATEAWLRARRNATDVATPPVPRGTSDDTVVVASDLSE